MEELLQCLILKELKDATQNATLLEQEPVFFRNFHSSEGTYIIHHLRYAMKKMNTYSGKTGYPPSLVHLQCDVGILHQHFVPTHAFENSVILLGTCLPLRATYGSKRGVLLLWKRKDVGQIHVLDSHPLDLRHLKPKQWTCLSLWNSNGTLPVNLQIPEHPLLQHPASLPLPDGQCPADPHHANILWPLMIVLVMATTKHLMIRLPAQDPPHHPYPRTHLPGPDSGSQPPGQLPSQPQYPPHGHYPPGPPHPGNTAPSTLHQPIPQQHIHQPSTLPLQPVYSFLSCST